MKPTYTEVYRPNSPLEVMMIKMTLERDRIDYFIANENLNSIFPPGGVFGMGDMRLMVETGRVQDCMRILKEELGYL